MPGRRVNWNFFHMLGVKPQLGRLFTEADDEAGAAPTALISHGLWMEKFGGDPGVIGKTISLDGNPFEVIGVLPPGFELLRRDEIFVPLGLWFTPDHNLIKRSNQFPLYVLGRLKPGVTERQARAEWRRCPRSWSANTRQTNSNTERDGSQAGRFAGGERAPGIAGLVGCGRVRAVDCLCECGESDAGARGGTRAGTGCPTWRWAPGAGASSVNCSPKVC